MNPGRRSGLLLHPSSLASPYGIGDLGDAAYQFVDFLQASGQRLWQVLPLGPTGYGNSPYQSYSAFAGNPLLLSLDLLRHDGLLSSADFAEAPQFDRDQVDFEAVRGFHWQMLTRAHRAFLRLAEPGLRDRFQQYCEDNADWLDDYALFVAIKAQQQGASWNHWPAALRDREALALKDKARELADALSLQRFVQFIFAQQWSALKAYANHRDVEILGDLPIFVAQDSADVWANPEQFLLDATGQPTVVAGVPPDYYSETGQLWGNPLYNWKRMAADNYAWWTRRLKAALGQADLVRLDHFRGFAAFWEIPAAATTAVDGRWVAGPGENFFRILQKAVGGLPLVAEDLGLITKDVHALRRALGIPGMAVLHFAFGGEADNIYLPHNVEPNSVIYTGTHDNNTSCGWYDEIDEHTREHVRRYFGCQGQEIAWGLIRAAQRSVAQTVVIPVQDLLSLGASARMNTPSSTSGNWAWRMREGVLDKSISGRLRAMTKMFGRCDQPSKIEAQD